MKISSLQYGELVKEYSPNSHLWIDTLNAFWTGGLICVLGQLILKGWGLLGLDQDGASTATAISMVFLGALCTGIGIYDPHCKACRGRHSGAHNRLCQFRGFTCHGV